MNTTIIGIDCAAQPRDTGLALGFFDGRTAAVSQVIARLKTDEEVVTTVAGWISAPGQTLLALDAPLGWPAALGSILAGHNAGERLDAEAGTLFRRHTDCVVRDNIRKQSLDVGADRIARTAHAALRLLDNLRRKTGQEIPLAWEPASISGICAIEVYPAATLRVHGLPDSGYKGGDGDQARRSILDRMESRGLRLPGDERRKCENCDDALDAVVCVLAGADFLRGNVIYPTDLQKAKKEGWIWVRNPGRSQSKGGRKSS